MSIEKAQQTVLETILRPGQVVAGKYCVDSLIGKGGMAAVWAGTNQRTGKRVALKVILRSFASTPEADEMFRREALAASRVNHPNVVNVFDVVEHEGMTCIVMELLDGEPLGAYLSRKGRLGIEEAVTLLLPAMRGVAAANALGIIHRDLKPQNIFVCIDPDGRPLTTKVLDFGISMMVERAIDAAAQTVVTMHGTPAYMSPEHIMNAPDIDERADVYGFGVLLFEALTGQLPFAGDPGPALLMRVLNEPAPKASLLRPDLKPDMVATIERALAKAPRERFPTVNQFITALEEHFLPPSPLPRSLTPLVGVPLFDRATGLADPIVQVGRRAEESGPHSAGETRALFFLPASAPSADGGSVRRLSQPRSAFAARAPAAVRDEASPVGKARGSRLLASVGAFIGTAVLVGWIATPRFGQRRPTVPPRSTPPAPAFVPAVAEQASSATTVPAAVKEPIPPNTVPATAPSASVTPAATKARISLPSVEPLPSGQTLAAPQGRLEVEPAARNGGNRPGLSARSRGRGRALPGGSETRARTENLREFLFQKDLVPPAPAQVLPPPSPPPPKPAPPRAGTLSADDF